MDIFKWYILTRKMTILSFFEVMLNRLFLLTLVILFAGCGKPSGGISGVWITEDYSRVLVLQKDGTYILSEAVDSEFAGGILYKSSQGKFKQDKSVSGISLKIPSGTLILTESLSASSVTEYSFPSLGNDQPPQRLMAFNPASSSIMTNYVNKDGQLSLPRQKRPFKLSVHVAGEGKLFTHTLSSKGKREIQIAEIESSEVSSLLFLHQEEENAAFLTALSQSKSSGRQAFTFLNNPLGVKSNPDIGLRFTVNEEKGQYVISEASSF